MKQKKHFVFFSNINKFKTTLRSDRMGWGMHNRSATISNRSVDFCDNSNLRKSSLLWVLRSASEIGHLDKQRTFRHIQNRSHSRNQLSTGKFTFQRYPYWGVFISVFIWNIHEFGQTSSLRFKMGQLFTGRWWRFTRSFPIRSAPFSLGIWRQKRFRTHNWWSKFSFLIGKFQIHRGKRMIANKPNQKVRYPVNTLDFLNSKL